MGEWHKDCHIAVKSAVLIYCLDIFAGKSAYYGIQYACGPQCLPHVVQLLLCRAAVSVRRNDKNLMDFPFLRSGRACVRRSLNRPGSQKGVFHVVRQVNTYKNHISFGFVTRGIFKCQTACRVLYHHGKNTPFVPQVHDTFGPAQPCSGGFQHLPQAVLIHRGGHGNGT